MNQTQITNESRCLLASYCRNAASSSCTNACGSFIALHGHSGTGGRAAASLLPREYALTTLESSPVGANQLRIYTQLVQLVDTFSRQFEAAAHIAPSDRIKSVYLWSDETGTGKTTTAAALLNEWLIAHYIGSIKRGAQPLQVPAVFIDVNELQTYYNEFNRKNIPQDVGEKASREYYRRLELARSVPFVVLDDLGVRDATEGFRGDLHSVINARVSKQLTTVYTSNHPLDALENTYDRRLYDRVRDLTLQFEFKGESKRGKRK